MQQTRPKPFAPPFDGLPITEQISEIGYKRLLELAKCAYTAVNRAYPMEERKDNLKVDFRYQEAHRQVKQHLNFYKSAIRDGIVPFATLTRHKEAYDDSQDRSTQDFRKLVVGQFTMLRERLVDYADLIVPEEADVKTFLLSLDKVFAREMKLLLDGEPGVGIAHYEAAPRYVIEDFQ